MEFVRSRGVADAAIVPGIFWTGKLSPVRTASLTKKSVAFRTTPSPGTRSPAHRFTTSPGTSSSIETGAAWPSRTTVARVCTLARSATTADCALYSLE
jgi:hypothetical protein